MGVYEHSSETTIYDQPALCYAVQSDMFILLSGAPVLVNLEIPLVLTSYRGPSRKPTPLAVNVLPGMDLDSNTTFGGVTVAEGNLTLPHALLEGYIDTPLTGDEYPYAVSDLIVNGKRRYYASMIVAYLEGRAATTSNSDGMSGGWQRVDPLWFRDPYGRVYNNPKITDFNATFIEGVPLRTNFTMDLIL